MNYSREFGSQFPSSLIGVGTKKDIDNSVKDLINQYNAYCDAGCHLLRPKRGLKKGNRKNGQIKMTT